MLISINTDFFKLNLSPFSVILVGYINTLDKKEINISKTLSILNTTKNELFKALQELNDSNVIPNKINELKDKFIITNKEEIAVVDNNNLNNSNQQATPIAIKKHKISDNTKKINGICDRTIRFLNEIMDKKLNPKGSTTFKLVKALIAEGYTERDIIEVISKKYIDWYNWEKYKIFMVPGTLFRNDNFDRYLNDGILQNNWKFNQIRLDLPDLINKMKITYMQIYNKEFPKFNFLKDSRIQQIMFRSSPYKDLDKMDIKDDDKSVDDIMDELSKY